MEDVEGSTDDVVVVVSVGGGGSEDVVVVVTPVTGCPLVGSYGTDVPSESDMVAPAGEGSAFHAKVKSNVGASPRMIVKP